jgi:hypothetical protein
MRRKNNVILAGKDINVIDFTKNSARFYGPGQTRTDPRLAVQPCPGPARLDSETDSHSGSVSSEAQTQTARVRTQEVDRNPRLSGDRHHYATQ